MSSTSSPSVLVLGARGRFGRAGTRAFAKAGWRVIAQVRAGGGGPQIAGAQWLETGWRAPRGEHPALPA